MLDPLAGQRSKPAREMAGKLLQLASTGRCLHVIPGDLRLPLMLPQRGKMLAHLDRVRTVGKVRQEPFEVRHAGRLLGRVPRRIVAAGPLGAGLALGLDAGASGRGSRLLELDGAGGGQFAVVAGKLAGEAAQEAWIS